jgi:hypothetical protein
VSPVMTALLSKNVNLNWQVYGNSTDDLKHSMKRKNETLENHQLQCELPVLSSALSKTAQLDTVQVAAAEFS